MEEQTLETVKRDTDIEFRNICVLLKWILISKTSIPWICFTKPRKFTFKLKGFLGYHIGKKIPYISISKHIYE